MQLIVITPENDLANEIGSVNALFESGLDRLHLRKPTYDYSEYKHYIEQIAPQHRQKITIHGAWELYHNQMAGGIHLRSPLRGTPEATELIQKTPRSAISTSFHSWQEVIDFGADYGSVFISPLFDSISKQGYKAAVRPEEIAQTKAALIAQNKLCPQIIGLGGINSQNVGSLKSYGYNGAALLGAIWNAPHPIQAFKAIKKAINGKTD